MNGYISLGRRRNDLGFSINFNKTRAIVRANTSLIANGIALEEIPSGASTFYPGLVLIHKDWKNVYFVIERKGWMEDQYFDLADELFEKHGIVKP